METYVAALDQGTTSSRAILFDRAAGRSSATAQQPFRQIYPQPGWVEHDPMEIWATEHAGPGGGRGRSPASTPEQIAAIGITNQRETTILWDRRHRAAGLQRHRLAVPPDRAHLRTAEGATAWAA